MWKKRKIFIRKVLRSYFTGEFFSALSAPRNKCKQRTLIVWLYAKSTKNTMHHAVKTLPTRVAKKKMKKKKYSRNTLKLMTKPFFFFLSVRMQIIKFLMTYNTKEKWVKQMINTTRNIKKLSDEEKKKKKNK